MLKIDPEGGLTGHRFTIGPCGLYQECGQARELPCGREIFYFKVEYGNMSGQGFRFRESDNMTLNECRFKCAENCSCFACAPTNSVANTGCEFWSKGAKFAKISDPNFVRPIYIFEPKAGKPTYIFDEYIYRNYSTISLQSLIYFYFLTFQKISSGEFL